MSKVNSLRSQVTKAMIDLLDELEEGTGVTIMVLMSGI